MGTQAKEAKGFHTHQSGPRTYADVKEFLQTDPTIRVMKSGIEGIFGGLWILLLVTVSFAFAEVVRVWVFGFKDEKEQRKLRYFADRKNRITITLFCIITNAITTVGQRAICTRWRAFVMVTIIVWTQDTIIAITRT